MLKYASFDLANPHEEKVKTHPIRVVLTFLRTYRYRL